MILSLRTRLFVAALGLIATVSAASAAPPPGFRWSDTVGRRTAPVRPVMVAPVGPAIAATSSTITVRGPDGVLRTYPVAGSGVVIQGQGGQSIVTTPAPMPMPMPATPVTPR